MRGEQEARFGRVQPSGVLSAATPSFRPRPRRPRADFLRARLRTGETCHYRATGKLIQAIRAFFDVIRPWFKVEVTAADRMTLQETAPWLGRMPAARLRRRSRERIRAHVESAHMPELRDRVQAAVRRPWGSQAVERLFSGDNRVTAHQLLRTSLRAPFRFRIVPGSKAWLQIDRRRSRRSARSENCSGGY